jgi:hypothetical protein
MNNNNNITETIDSNNSNNDVNKKDDDGGSFLLNKTDLLSDYDYDNDNIELLMNQNKFQDQDLTSDSDNDNDNDKYKQNVELFTGCTLNKIIETSIFDHNYLYTIEKILDIFEYDEKYNIKDFIYESIKDDIKNRLEIQRSIIKTINKI